MPKVISKELHAGKLKYKSTERWFIIQDKYFLIKGMLILTIDDLEKDFNWLVWVMVSKKNLSEYIDLFTNDETISWSTQRVLAAEINFLKKSAGLKVMVNQKGKDNFPIVTVCEKGTELSNMQQDKIRKEDVTRIMELLYHEV